MAANFEGDFTDVNHPGCPRKIIFTSSTSLKVIGHDGDPEKPFKCFGVCPNADEDANIIVINFAPKGGPKDLMGKWTGTGICWIQQGDTPLDNDGSNSWIKVVPEADR